MRSLRGVEPKRGEPLGDLFAGAEGERQVMLSHFDRALGGEKFSTIADFEVAGGRRQYEILFSPIRDESGRVIGAAHISADITEWVTAHRELMRLAEQRQLALDAARM